MKKRVVVLISGSGSNLQALIDACANPHFPAHILGVISNKKDAFGLMRAQQAAIPTRTLNHQDFATREAFDQQLITLIDAFNADVVVLAGFMRILTPYFVQHYLGRLLNIHPSLLPLYPGLHTHQRALDAGDVEHGTSVHFVTPELDGGPIIVQAKVPVLPGDTAENLAQRVLTKEHLIYPLAIQWFAEGRIVYHQGQTWMDNQPLVKPPMY